MRKVVLCGTLASGKTCYVYAMLRSMMMGKAGFTLAAQGEDFDRLRLPIRRLSDTSLPFEERFPVGSSQTHKYMLDLLYHHQRVEIINLIEEYPRGYGVIADDSTSLDGAEGLLICVDGSPIQGGVDDVENIRYQLSFIKGGLELNHTLGQAALKHTDPGPRFPPICVMVTKYDRVSKELKKEEILADKIIKPIFSSVFETENVPIAICPVSLGADIETGGKLDPLNVEKPILFAMYWSLRRDYVDNLLRDGKDGPPFPQLRPPFPLAENDFEKRKEALTQCKNVCNAMLDSIGSTILYVNGEKKDWEDYRL